jgi:hypothetical protein
MHAAWRTYPSKVSSLPLAIMQRTADVVPDTMVDGRDQYLAQGNNSMKTNLWNMVLYLDA